MAVKKIIKKKPTKAKQERTKLASFGGITFVVSRKKILTPSDIKRGETTRWQVHEIAGKKPIPEFLGPGQEQITFHVEFRKSLGVDPFQTIQILRTFQSKGKASPFMIGKTTIADSKFYLEDLQETYQQIDAHGVIHTIGADLTIKEYSEIKMAKKSKKPKSKKTSNKSKNSRSSKKHIGTITIKANTLNARTSPSLKSRIKKVLRKGQKYRVYGTKKTDITWYNLGGGIWCSAYSTYSTFIKK